MKRITKKLVHEVMSKGYIEALGFFAEYILEYSELTWRREDRLDELDGKIWDWTQEWKDKEIFNGGDPDDVDNYEYIDYSEMWLRIYTGIAMNL